MKKESEFSKERSDASCSNKGIFKPVISLQKCVKTMRCIVVCPVNAISINKAGSPVINYSVCNRCLLCLRECPVGAITEERE